MGDSSAIKLYLSRVSGLATSGTTVCLLKPEISPSALGIKVSPRLFFLSPDSFCPLAGEPRNQCA